MQQHQWGELQALTVTTQSWCAIFFIHFFKVTWQIRQLFTFWKWLQSYRSGKRQKKRLHCFRKFFMPKLEQKYFECNWKSHFLWKRHQRGTAQANCHLEAEWIMRWHQSCSRQRMGGRRKSRRRRNSEEWKLLCVTMHRASCKNGRQKKYNDYDVKDRHAQQVASG